ncbi:unnamed protein product [Acidithrix sp. C25]|nr:unnamed protein product [Acidithrix sp. C25]
MTGLAIPAISSGAENRLFPNYITNQATNNAKLQTIPTEI